jgi:hypothetical protein
MAPTGPCFMVGPRSYFAFQEEFLSRQTGSLLSVVNGFFEKSTVYDARGQRWQSTGIESTYRRTWWTVLLANTVYNPWLSVTVLWGEPVAYDVDELKGAYSKAVKKDDDILTQFVSRAELQRKIAAAPSFADLVEVYRWMQTDSDSGDPESDDD